MDERIWLVWGDLGYSVLEWSAERLPDRFVNAGVAEQNRTELAAGVALCGNVVFTYSIANFLVMRYLEQIRNDAYFHLTSSRLGRTRLNHRGRQQSLRGLAGPYATSVVRRVRDASHPFRARRDPSPNDC